MPFSLTMGAPCEVALNAQKRLVRFLLNSFIVCRVRNASGLSSLPEPDSTTHHYRRQGTSASVLFPPALQTSIEYSHITNRRSYKNEAHGKAAYRVALMCQETSSKQNG